MNYSGQIIDFFSKDDNAIIKAMYSRTANTETLNLVVLSSKSTNFKERNRILIQDQMENYREFIIDHIEDSGQYTEVECTASYLVDIKTSKPIPAGKYEKMAITQKLSETLRDSGWTVGSCDFAGITTNSWTSVRTPLEMISQLETAHDVVADYQIVIDGYEVVERLVNMRKPVPLFKGKEIEYGKDLLSMKRTVDFSEVKTALFAFGPEREDGERINLIVHDDEAQQQLGLPQRYIWGIYEPETDDENMTEKRLETLAKTELNKHKTAAISYEISTVNLEQEYPHEIIRFGDIVRIKNSDFTPSIYAESEVIGFELDLISDDCTYQFGKVIEYKESDLRRYFESKLGYIRQKLTDGFTNVNTIVRESLDGELQYFERKIFKGNTPPENPVNDTLWLDTSNPNVAVLRRFFNGKWHNATAEKAGDVGAVTREQALYSELTNTFTNLSIQHARLLKEVYAVIGSKYLVDRDLKNNLNSKLDATVSVFNKIKTGLDGMTSETATIGNLIDIQSYFLEYRQKLQDLYNAVEEAKIAIDERFRLLQSQYTDEKFNDAMENVAKVIPGGKWDADKKVLTSNIPNEDRITEITSVIMSSAIENMHNQIGDIQNAVNANEQNLNQRISESGLDLRKYADTVAFNLKNEVNAGIQQLKDEVNISVKKVSEEVDGVKIGGRNLFRSYDKSLGSNVNPTILTTESFEGSYWAQTLYSADYLRKILVPGETYTYSYEMEIIGLSEFEVPYSKSHGIIFYSATNPKDTIASTYADIERVVGNKVKYTHTFVAPEITDHRFLIYSGLYTEDGTLNTKRASNKVRTTLLKLEKYGKATDWTPAPEDGKQYAETQKQLAIDEANAIAEKALAPIKIRTAQAENSIRALENALILKASKTEVERTLDNGLKPLQTKVDDQQAQLKIMSDSINSKVSKSDYTTDKNGIVQRLNAADTAREQLSNQINDRVTLNEFRTAEFGGRNLLVGTEDMSGFANGQKINVVNQGIIFSTIKDESNNRIWVTQEVTVEPNTDYTLSFYAYKTGVADTNVYCEIRAIYSDFRDFDPIKRITSKSIPVINNIRRYSITFRVEGYRAIRIYLGDIDSQSTSKSHVGKPQLEKGLWMSDYKTAQEDTELALNKLETQITQNGKEINARATSEEFNASRRTLSRVLADFVINTTTGLTLTYDENGSIQSHTVGPGGVKIDTKKFVINDGDVIVQNGRTTIKDVYIDKLFATNAFITKLKTVDLSAQKVQVAYNSINSAINITSAGLETTSGGQRTSLVNENGHHFYYEGKYVGHIGTSYIQGYPNERGLRLSLDDFGNYMAFSYRHGALAPGDPTDVAMLWSRGGAGYTRGFHFNEDIKIHHNRVLETLYLRPNGAPIANRLYFNYSTFNNVGGNYIRFYDQNGSGMHFSNDQVTLIARKGTDGGWAALKLAHDHLSSVTVYNRTYSAASNVYINSYGVIGRATSASKYKLVQERQFKDDDEQYNHSKRVLDLNIKTWFDKFESETYAREILTGEKQEEESFKLRRYAGLIAEDVEAVGLDEFVTRGKDDEIEGIEYDRLWIHLIPVIKKQMAEIENLKTELEVLKNGK